MLVNQPRKTESSRSNDFDAFRRPARSFLCGRGEQRGGKVPFPPHGSYFLFSSLGSTTATRPNFVFPTSVLSIPTIRNCSGVPALSSLSMSLPFTFIPPPFWSPHVRPLFVAVNEPTGFPWLHSNTSPYFANGFL